MENRILIVGSGFGGLETALCLKSLLHSGEAITVVDKKDHQSFLPSIHEIISGKVRPTEIQIPIRPLFDAAGIQFYQEEVLSLEPHDRRVLTSVRTRDYDYLVLACGARVNFYDVPGAAEFAHAFRSPEQAEQIGKDVSKTLEDESRPGRILIIGGGLEGVEIAGELLDLIGGAGRREDLHSGKITVELIESADRLLPECPEKVQNFVEDYLASRGITILKGHRVAEVQPDRVTLVSGEVRQMSLLIWTGGIQPAGWIQDTTLPRDEKGWLKVTRALHCPGDERVYGLGDTVTIVTDHGVLSLPRLASHTLDQSAVVALNVYYHMRGRREIGYYPKAKPQLISLGKKMGIVTEGELFIPSPWAVRLKKAVEKRHIMAYRSKPYTSSLTARLPGAEFRHLLRIMNPV